MSIRQTFERGVAGVTFGGAFLLVYGGTIIACLRGTGLFA
jgi:hypothetical protein